MCPGRTVAVIVVVAALAACGGGSKKSNAAATGSSSNGSSLSAGSGAPGASASSSVSASSSASSAGDSPVVGTGRGGGGSSDQASSSGGGDAPGPPGLKPFPGHYTYQTSGQSSGPVVVTVEDLSDTDQRTTTPVGQQGEQVQALRYLNDRIDLVSLEMKGAFPKTFNGPVMYAPIPTPVGASWAWDLTSTDNLTHVHQSSKVVGTEVSMVGGQSVDTVVVETDITITGDVNATGHLTTLASPVYKLPVSTHSTLHVTTPVNFNSDNTAELTNLRPS